MLVLVLALAYPVSADHGFAVRSASEPLLPILEEKQKSVKRPSSLEHLSITFPEQQNPHAWDEAKQSQLGQSLASNALKALALLFSVDDLAVGWRCPALKHGLVLRNLPVNAIGLVMQKEQVPMDSSPKLHNIKGLICEEQPVAMKCRKLSSVTILSATQESWNHVMNVAYGEDIFPTAGESSFNMLSSDDPHGFTLWPAAPQLAEYLLELDLDLSNQTILEVGAGTGLVSIAASHKFKEVSAVDFEETPLALLRYAAEHLNPASGKIRTATFDISDFEQGLPTADFIVASDILYADATARDMAKRVIEALRRGSRVIIGDSGLEARPAFLEELRSLLNDDTIEFTSHQQRDNVGILDLMP